MASQNSGKKRSNRGWWWDHSTEHPGYANKEERSMVSRKVKVICTGAYEQCITREQQADQEQIRLGQCDSPWDISVITSARMSDQSRFNLLLTRYVQFGQQRKMTLP
jgi:hypothetical protein